MIEPEAFLDANILLRHFIQDNPDQWPQCTALISELSEGKRSVLITDTVIFESVYVLEKQYRVQRVEIARQLLEFIKMPTVVLSGKHFFSDTFDLYVRKRGLSFGDCYHAVFAMKSGIPRFLTFDRRMGSIPGLERIEP